MYIYMCTVHMYSLIQSLYTCKIKIQVSLINIFAMQNAKANILHTIYHMLICIHYTAIILYKDPPSN